jgi:MerR family transcriptional regulator, thiopeptide resistance regulator
MDLEKTGMTKELWVGILRAAGLDDAGLHAFHRELERRAPASHEAFLRWLGIGAEEAARIRAAAR